MPRIERKKIEKATFAAGCFWGVEEDFRHVRGVVEVITGYTGGHKKNPRYAEVSAGQTGHAEAVEVYFDPAIVSYNELLDIFWEMHDPTQLNRQGLDEGTQYRSAIFSHNARQEKMSKQSKEKLAREKRYDKEIVTEILPAQEFFKAEEYHQRYLEKHKIISC